MPPNIRTYATWAPEGSRSILKMLPETSASLSPSAAGSKVVNPFMIESTPAPVSADPKKIGYAEPTRVSSARRRRPGWSNGRNAAALRPARSTQPRAIADGLSLSTIRVDDQIRSGAQAIDLVDEDDRRDAQALQGAHQHLRLSLDAFDGRHDQHRAVEHAQHALDLGDEVRVTGGVDQIHRDVVDHEGDDGGLDGDPALPLEVERVGLGVAVVDAAGSVDDSGGEEQPLGQAGLTGVDVRQDAKIQEFHSVSCP